MAYITKEQKDRIFLKLKDVFPKGWSYSLRISDYTAITLTIKKAPFDLIELVNERNRKYAERRGEPAHVINDGHAQLNVNTLTNLVEGHAELEALFDKIVAALYSEGWYDNSDSQRDYFDVAYYVNINLGSWNQPFRLSK